jgi:hypothetical protein
LTNVVSFNGGKYNATKYFKELYFTYLKEPVDTIPMSFGNVEITVALKSLREWYFNREWFEILDFVEYHAVKFPDLISDFNIILEREGSAYRFVDTQLVEIVNEEEIAEIEKALNSHDKYKGVKIHLNTALTLMANRDNPDYRNSVKESISAIESLAIIITGNTKGTLGELLKTIQLPSALKKGFSTLYGYTSSEDGIRHALLDEPSVSLNEARYMLITCSAFANYLIAKDT